MPLLIAILPAARAMFLLTTESLQLQTANSSKKIRIIPVIDRIFQSQNGNVEIGNGNIEFKN
ncbi:MAG: hypothetical protein LBP85_08545 [Prevotellaceae bacterium]|nr:hypothetical protein [Prevotellaceae bacterium]